RSCCASSRTSCSSSTPLGRPSPRPSARRAWSAWWARSSRSTPTSSSTCRSASPFAGGARPRDLGPGPLHFGAWRAAARGAGAPDKQLPPLVVRRFLGDRDVVRVALAQAGGADPDEARSGAQLLD